MLRAVFCDIDGCMGDFVKPSYPLKQDLYNNKEGLKKIKEKVRSFHSEVLFGVCTARGFYEADHIMHYSGHTGPSIFEMGNEIFDKNRGGSSCLFESHEKFRKDVRIIRDFIKWRESMTDFEEELRQKFSDSQMKQIRTRSYMLTYEFEEDIGKELRSYLLNIMPPEFNKAIERGLLKILLSQSAVDILPNLTKGDAVNKIIGDYEINKEEVLAIGDSSHSDLSLLESAGLVACPNNADRELKEYVRERGGYVAKKEFHEGLLEIYDFFRTGENGD